MERKEEIQKKRKKERKKEKKREKESRFDAGLKQPASEMEIQRLQDVMKQNDGDK